LPVPSRIVRHSTILALLALVLAGGPSALAAGRASGVADSTPEPRVLKPGDTPGFSLPFPAGMSVLIHQGWHSRYSHTGLAAYAYDFGLPEETPVLAAARGVVSFVHSGEKACGGPWLVDHANFVTINHADGSATQYGHLSTVGVEVGDVVAPGQEIGRSGKTGFTNCSPHLHFARQLQGGPVTQSIPVYFTQYADQQLVMGEVVSHPAPDCSAAITQAAPRAQPASSRRPAAGDPEPARARPAASVLTSGTAPLDAFCGAYYPGRFDGPAYFTRQSAVLSFDWSTEGPGGYWLDHPAGGFSARWSGRFTFPTSGRYTLAVLSSDGVRLFVDGIEVLDRKPGKTDPMESVVTRELVAGIHRIDVEQVSTDGTGVLKLGWGRLFDG